MISGLHWKIRSNLQLRGKGGDRREEVSWIFDKEFAFDFNVFERKLYYVDTDFEVYNRHLTICLRN